MGEWQQIHENLVRIAKRRAELDARETRLLREAHRLGIVLDSLGVTARAETRSTNDPVGAATALGVVSGRCEGCHAQFRVAK